MFSALRTRFSSGAGVPDIAIVNHPSDQFRGDFGFALFTGQAESPHGAVTYQWQQSTNSGVTWTDISGETNGFLYVDNITDSFDGYRYRLVASVAGYQSVTSMAATLRVPIMSYTQTPTTAIADSGQATFTGVVSINYGYDLFPNRPTFMWLRSTDGGATYQDYSAGTASYTNSSATSTLQLSGLDYSSHNYQFRLVTSISGGQSITAADAGLVVTQPVVIISQDPSPQTASGGAAVFSVSAYVVYASPGQEAISYQWQRSTDSGATWANITGATSSSLSLTSLSQSSDGYQYRVLVSAQYAATKTSAAATLTVPPPTVTITSHPQDVTTSADSVVPVQFSVSATVSDGSTLSYQWQRLIPPSTTWQTLGGGFATYTPAVRVDDGQQFRVIVTAGSATATSNTATLNIPSFSIARTYPGFVSNAFPVSTTQPSDLSLPDAIFVGSVDAVAVAGGITGAYDFPADPAGPKVRHMHAERLFVGGVSKYKLYVATESERLLIAERQGTTWTTIANESLPLYPSWVYRNPEMEDGTVYLVGENLLLRRTSVATSTISLIPSGLTGLEQCFVVGNKAYVFGYGPEIAVIDLGDISNGFAMTVDSVFSVPEASTRIIKGFAPRSTTDAGFIYVGVQGQSNGTHSLLRILNASSTHYELPLPAAAGGINDVIVGTQGYRDVVYVLCTNAIVVCIGPTGVQTGSSAGPMTVHRTIAVSGTRVGGSSSGRQYVIQSATPSTVYEIMWPDQTYLDNV
jgi:hypothetical protein